MISDNVHGFGNSMVFYDMLISTLPIGSRILECGVFYGRGLVHLAQRLDLEIWGVDRFIRDAMPNHLPHVLTDADFYAECRNNLDKNNASHVILISKTSADSAPMFKDGYFDCVFIDGEHAYEPVRDDIALWTPKVKPGGYLAGDDYILPWGGVIQAVDEAFPHRTVEGQTWWVKL